MFNLDELQNIPKSREIVDKIMDMRDNGYSLNDVQSYIDGIEKIPMNNEEESVLSVLAEHFTDEEMCEMIPDEDEDYFYMENW